jgi:hypothetical protein
MVPPRSTSSAPLSTVIGVGHRARHHFFLAHAELRRQVERHAAHGALRQHPHGAEAVPGERGLVGVLAVGQDLG